MFFFQYLYNCSQTVIQNEKKNDTFTVSQKVLQKQDKHNKSFMFFLNLTYSGKLFIYHENKPLRLES